MICKGTWQPTSCATTITNPVGQQLTPTHPPETPTKGTSPCTTNTNSHPCSQCVQWIQPRGPAGIPTPMPDHIQCSPPELHIRVSQGILHNKLPKEIGSRMV